ncbi:MAG TPA: 4Fe-4S double cluster binding domain-containing protein [Clostridiales bacterium]|mgnify:CR=1 FL=1|nr:4Fe-4S double cluster binding domain-containing protein [Clostridiales bacterium]
MEYIGKNLLNNDSLAGKDVNIAKQDTKLNLEDKLRELILGLGGSFVGFSDVSKMLPESLKKYPYAISFGIRLSDAIIDEIEDKPTFTYFNHYRSVNALIDQIGLRIMLFLQDNGYKAYTIAASQSIPDAPEPFSGVFPHKTGAVASGQGWIGKNGLFIHREFGPRVRLGTVLTDSSNSNLGDMECSEGNIILKSRCSSCNRCVEACPAMALTGKEWHIGMKREEIIDARACSEYMNKNFKHIGRGSVCGICIKVCPCSK